VETEDVVHVLRNVQPAVVPGGQVLDIHPLGIDMAVRAGPLGLGFVDATEFARVIEEMDEAVAEVCSEGLLTELLTERRLVAERYDTPEEALEEAASWVNLRLPPRVARRIRDAEERPIELVDTVRYRLFSTPS
jgi:predicted DNA-binding protein (UPF0278 family)